MNFNSWEYLIFLPVVLLLYRALPRRLRKYWLLAASWFFYMYWNPLLILLLLASTAVDFFCGLGMEKWKEKPARRRALLWCSLCMNLGMLFFFKYWDFFGEMAGWLLACFGLGWRPPALHLILPVGISFYTFQTMSYTIDVYRGKTPAERDPVTFALYVAFFPQLVAGPIERPGDLLPQLKRSGNPDGADVRAGIAWLVSGFFRKCVIADMVGISVDRVYAGLGTANSLAVLAGSFLFLVQMYNDFAGYSEIAMGSARLLGVKLTRNFDRPLLSGSYTEFFRRWHITLNRWFTDYVYIPLGGSRRGPLRRMLNTMIVFLLCGLWHGANMTYVLWGAVAGVMVCLETLFRKKKADTGNRGKGAVLFAALRRMGILLLFTLSSVLFRAPTVADVGTAFSRIVTGGGWSAAGFAEAAGTLGLTVERICFLIPALGTMALLPRLTADAKRGGSAHSALLRAAIYVFAVLTIAFCWLELLSASDVSSFQYFQF